MRRRKDYASVHFVSTYVPDSGDKLKFIVNMKLWHDAIRKHLNSLQVRFYFVEVWI